MSHRCMQHHARVLAGVDQLSVPEEVDRGVLAPQ